MEFFSNADLTKLTFIFTFTSHFCILDRLCLLDYGGRSENQLHLAHAYYPSMWPCARWVWHVRMWPWLSVNLGLASSLFS
jgi:hypothetical protein